MAKLEKRRLGELMLAAVVKYHKVAMLRIRAQTPVILSLYQISRFCPLASVADLKGRHCGFLLADCF